MSELKRRYLRSIAEWAASDVLPRSTRGTEVLRLLEVPARPRGRPEILRARIPVRMISPHCGLDGGIRNVPNSRTSHPNATTEASMIPPPRMVAAPTPSSRCTRYSALSRCFDHLQPSGHCELGRNRYVYKLWARELVGQAGDGVQVRAMGNGGESNGELGRRIGAGRATAEPEEAPPPGGLDLPVAASCHRLLLPQTYLPIRLVSGSIGGSSARSDTDNLAGGGTGLVHPPAHRNGTQRVGIASTITLSLHQPRDNGQRRTR